MDKVTKIGLGKALKKCISPWPLEKERNHAFKETNGLSIIIIRNNCFMDSMIIVSVNVISCNVVVVVKEISGHCQIIL